MHLQPIGPLNCPSWPGVIFEICPAACGIPSASRASQVRAFASHEAAIRRQLCGCTSPNHCFAYSSFCDTLPRRYPHLHLTARTEPFWRTNTAGAYKARTAQILEEGGCNAQERYGFTTAARRATVDTTRDRMAWQPSIRLLLRPLQAVIKLRI